MNDRAAQSLRLSVMCLGQLGSAATAQNMDTAKRRLAEPKIDPEPNQLNTLNDFQADLDGVLMIFQTS